MTHPYFQGTTHPRVFAHRGLADVAAWENTAASFAAAHAAGAEYIETDCRLTADGDVVLFHDPTLERLCGDARTVASVRTAELAAILAPHGGLLSVREALESFPESRFNIDVKEDAAAAPLGRAIARFSDRVLVTSFSDARRRRAVTATLRSGAALAPATSAGQGLVAQVRVRAALGLPCHRLLRGIDALQIPESYGAVRILTPRVIAIAHREGVEIHVWTVNDPAKMTELIRLGVDGIVTDRADLAIDTLRV